VWTTYNQLATQLFIRYIFIKYMVDYITTWFIQRMQKDAIMDN